MRCRVRRLLALWVAALGLGLGGRTWLHHGLIGNSDAVEVEGESDPKDSSRLRELTTAGRRIAFLHAIKSKPRPGEWLARHAEPGQTFDEYRASFPNRPTRLRYTFYVQPWGEFDANQSALIERTAEWVGCFYGVPVTIRSPWRLATVPAEARRRRADWDDERLSTGYLLSALESSRPNDALAVIAFTPSDLSPGGGRWVFGEASLLGGAAVVSLFRQGDPRADFTLALRRTLKTAVHETGHALGLIHCTAYECGMNGSSSRAEADSRPLAFCPECEQKVWWACRLDPASRYDHLAAFAEKNGLRAESAFWKASRRALEAGRGVIDH